MGISGRIAALFQQNALTPLLALVLLLLGVFATLITPKEEEPQIDVTMADVMVAFPGASAKDVENLVVRPGEQVLSRMHGVEHVYSMSRPGMAVITVQFKVGVKNQDAIVRLYDTIHSNQDWLSPQLGVMPPIVKPKGIDDVPVLGVTLWSRDEASALEVERVARGLVRVGGVAGRVRFAGRAGRRRGGGRGAAGGARRVVGARAPDRGARRLVGRRRHARAALRGLAG